jgi:hypothetical protein
MELNPTIHTFWESGALTAKRFSPVTIGKGGFAGEGCFWELQPDRGTKREATIQKQQNTRLCCK